MRKTEFNFVVWAAAILSVVALVATPAMANSCTNAAAGTIFFSFDAGSTAVHNGTLTLDGICQASTTQPTFTGWMITAISGSLVGGNSISEYAQYGFNGNDNLFNPSSTPAVSGTSSYTGGFAFQEAGTGEIYSFFWNPADNSYEGCWSLNSPCNSTNVLIVTRFTFSPEPASVALFGSGVVGLLAVIKRKLTL